MSLSVRAAAVSATAAKVNTTMLPAPIVLKNGCMVFDCTSEQSPH
jgi:hypothetical protein